MLLLISKNNHIVFSEKERFRYEVIDNIVADTASVYRTFKDTVKKMEIDTVPLFDSSFNSLTGFMQATRFRDMLFTLQEKDTSTELSDSQHVFLTSNYIPAWIKSSSVAYSSHFCGFTSYTSGVVLDKDITKYISTNADTDESGFLYKSSSDTDLSVTYATSNCNAIGIVPHANAGTQMSALFHTERYSKAIGGYPLIPGLINLVLAPEMLPYIDIVCFGSNETEQILHVESIVAGKFRSTETTWSFTAGTEGDWEVIAGTYPMHEFSVEYTRDNKNYVAVSHDFISRFYAKAGDIIKIKIPANTVINFIGYNVWYPTIS